MKHARNYGRAACLLAILLVSACGIKPHELDQPAGTQENNFPRAYPMPEGSFDASRS